MTLTDFILPFQTDRTGLRGRFVRLHHVVETIIKQHNYPEPVAYVLAQALALAAALSNFLKFYGIFTLQTKSDGPINMIIVDIASTGVMRGFAKYDQDQLTRVLAEGKNYKEQPVPILLGQGHMAFTIDQGTHTDLYQGITQLMGPTLAACAEHYFVQSEQIDALIKVAADFKSDKSVGQSAALMLQKMPPPSKALADEQRPIRIIPKETEEGWVRAKLYFETIKPDEMLSLQSDPNDFLYSLFHEDEIRVYPMKELSFGCRCDRDRLGNFLHQLSSQERQEIAEKNIITVTCDFCNQSYIYDLKEFEA